MNPCQTKEISNDFSTAVKTSDVKYTRILPKSKY